MGISRLWHWDWDWHCIDTLAFGFLGWEGHYWILAGKGFANKWKGPWQDWVYSRHSTYWHSSSNIIVNSMTAIII